MTEVERKPLQFSLRTVLLFVSAICVTFAQLRNASLTFAIMMITFGAALALSQLAVRQLNAEAAHILTNSFKILLGAVLGGVFGGLVTLILGLLVSIGGWPVSILAFVQIGALVGVCMGMYFPQFAIDACFVLVELLASML